MTRDETKTIIRGIATCFPNWKPQNMTETINLYAALLEGYPYQVISAALKAYIMTGNAFAPNPGQLVQMLPKTDRTEPLEAWGLVRKALQNGIYGSEEEYAKLPDAVQRAVGSPQQLSAWAMAPEDQLETVMQSNFLRTYSAICQRREAEALIPDDVRRILQGATQKQIAEKEGA